MVLRVDVVAAALDAVYGDDRPPRVIALTPQGRQLDQALVEELVGEPSVALLSSRFEGFDERIVEHLCTDAISIGPYVLSGGELPAMVRRRRHRPAAPGRARRRIGRARELLERARRRSRVPALHATRVVSRLGGAGGAPLRRPRRGSSSGAGTRAACGPRGDRATGSIRGGLARPAAAATPTSSREPAADEPGDARDWHDRPGLGRSARAAPAGALPRHRRRRSIRRQVRSWPACSPRSWRGSSGGMWSS